jgi:hypothetical protein
MRSGVLKRHREERFDASATASRATLKVSEDFLLLSLQVQPLKRRC